MTTYDFIAANKRRSILLIVVFGLLVLGVGWLADRYFQAGGSILVFAGIYSIVTALVGYYSGDRVALAVSGAHRITEKDHPYLVRMIQNLCITTGQPEPKMHLIDDPAINAFATGRDPQHASIAVTTGAVKLLENEELEGVLAHELSHVRNYDIRVMTLVMVLAGTVAIIADLALHSALWGGRRRREGGGWMEILGLVLLLVAPLVAQLIKLAVSRRREYLADSSAALITRFPEGLARALRKIQSQSRPMKSPSSATAHLFLANPFTGKSLAALFSTHPPIEKRIAALEKMSGPALD